MATISMRTNVAGGSGFPDGVSPPLAVDSPYDHSGLVIVVTATCMAFALVSFGLRVYFQVSRMTVKCDDVFLTVATVSTLMGHLRLN